MSTRSNQESLDEPLTILLVEDNAGDIRLTQEAFDEIETETTLHVVTDRDEAIEFLGQQGEYESAPSPALVLLDLNLPDGDGCEVLEAIRGDDPLRRLPVLVLTSSDANTDIVRCYESHVNAYLTKPSDANGYLSLAKTVEHFWFERARLPPIPT